ncbi:hypothetical protein EDB83DRAFT_2315414 [Lactarius deliciosus]|nr:hypothetical protein EDB83DRAFT_2315414 [Lactarius deliciosus]
MDIDVGGHGGRGGVGLVMSSGCSSAVCTASVIVVARLRSSLPLLPSPRGCHLCVRRHSSVVVAVRRCVVLVVAIVEVVSLLSTSWSSSLSLRLELSSHLCPSRSASAHARPDQASQRPGFKGPVRLEQRSDARALGTGKELEERLQVPGTVTCAPLGGVTVKRAVFGLGADHGHGVCELVCRKPACKLGAGDETAKDSEQKKEHEMAARGW